MVFVVLIVVEIFFVNILFYIGFIVKVFGGVDIVWLIGIIVFVILYYFLMK